MTPSIETTIRSHLEANDAAQDPIEWAEIVARLETKTPITSPRRGYRRGLWGAVTAAALTLLLFGLLPLLRGDEEPPPANTVVPTTAVDPITPSTLAPEPDLETQSLSNDFATVPYEAIEAEVGTITWTRLEGDHDTVPSDLAGWPWEYPFFQADDGSYVFAGQARTWRSVDGLNWSFEEGELSPPLRYDSAWRTGGDLEVVHIENGVEQVFLLPDVSLPDVEGLAIEVLVTPPQSLGNGMVYVAGEVSGAVPWGDLYGTFRICQDDGQCYDEPPFVEFGENVVWVREVGDISIEGPRLIGKLRVDVSDTSIVFTDFDTGELVHEISADSPAVIQEIINDLRRGDVVRTELVGWVGSDTVPFVAVSTPPGDHGHIVNLPDGGVGQFADLEPRTESGSVSVAWITADGITWESALPAFVNDGVERAYVYREGDVLLARVLYRGDGQERWSSTDGIQWQRLFQYPAESRVTEAAIGLVSLSTSDRDALRGYPVIHVSNDGGETWASVPGPPQDEYYEYHPGESAHGELYGAAGDLVWILIEPESQNDTPILWIGKFDQ